jgi:hypothetical protein
MVVFNTQTESTRYGPPLFVQGQISYQVALAGRNVLVVCGHLYMYACEYVAFNCMCFVFADKCMMLVDGKVWKDYPIASFMSYGGCRANRDGIGAGAAASGHVYLTISL